MSRPTYELKELFGVANTATITQRATKAFLRGNVRVVSNARTQIRLENSAIKQAWRQELGKAYYK